MTLIWSVAAVVLTSWLIADEAGAQGRGNKERGAEASVEASIIFSDTHRVRVREYLVAHPMQLTALPPGIAKNVARGKRLPPGIAKRRVPREVLVLLPPPRPGITFSIIGDMVVAERAGVVIDVMLRIVG